MKTFEQYNNNEKEMEELFLELAHLDELEIKFNFVSPGTSNKLNIFYLYNGYILFIENKLYTNCWVSFDLIWKTLSIRFGINYHITKEFMKDMVNKHFKFDNYSVQEYIAKSNIFSSIV